MVSGTPKDWSLHPQLAQDTVPIGDLALARAPAPGRRWERCPVRVADAATSPSEYLKPLGNSARFFRRKASRAAARLLAFSPCWPDIGPGGWRWTSHSPTGSDPEGSSPNEHGSGRSSASHQFPRSEQREPARPPVGWHDERNREVSRSSSR